MLRIILFHFLFIYGLSFHYIWAQMFPPMTYKLMSEKRYLRNLNNRVGEGAHNKQNHEDGENHNHNQESADQNHNHDQDIADHEQDQDPGQREGFEENIDSEPDRNQAPVDLSYVYYGPQAQPYYVSPCDPNDPHSYDKPECEYLRPTEIPTPSPSQEPSYFPTGSPTFKSRVDFSDAQVSVLMAADGYRDAHFGHAVALHYHVAAVGAYAEGSGGSAYVFQFDNVRGGGSGLRWNLVGNVNNPDETDDYFGYALALNNNTLYVGAYKSDISSSSAGAVYVFKDDGTGSQYQKTDILSSFTSSANEFFGFALCSDGEFTLVGAYGNNDKGTDAGAVYVFQLSESATQYSNSARLYSADASDYDAFGSALDFHGNDAVIGAHGDETRGTASGSAYIFSYNEGSRAWTQESKLVGSSVSAHDYFGYSVSIHDGIALVGAYHGDGKVDSSGVVYVFMKTSLKSGNSKLPGWYEVSMLFPADGASSSYFGYSVSVHNGMVIVGAPGDDTLANAAGSAYVYESGFEHWQMSYKLYGKGNQYDSFGCAVSIFGRVALAGSLLGDGVTTDSGSAFMFTPKDEYSVPKKKTSNNKQSESLESKLHLRFVQMEEEVEAASPFELIGAIGFLSVVIILFFSLILWIRKTKDVAPTTYILPLQQVRGVAENIVEQVVAKSKPSSSSSKTKQKPKKSRSKNSSGFQEIPIDSTHSSEGSVDDSSSSKSTLLSSLSTSNHKPGLAKPAAASFFSFSRTNPVAPSPVASESEDEGSDVDIREGKMALREDGSLDTRDKKKKKKLKIVELAKL